MGIDIVPSPDAGSSQNLNDVGFGLKAEVGAVDVESCSGSDSVVKFPDNYVCFLPNSGRKSGDSRHRPFDV